MATVDNRTPETTGIMIDAPDTADRDDAIWVQRSHNGFDAWVHVALVSKYLPHGGADDVAARQRMYTRYLPDRAIGMLPNEVERKASLRAGHPADTFCVYMSFASDAELVEAQVVEGRLEDAYALSYADAAQILNSSHTEFYEPLSEAQILSKALLNRRQRSGALAFYDLFAGYATNEEGQLIRLGSNQRNAGYLIVQELMIAANSAIATWCAKRDLPIVFRNHRAAAVAGDRADIRSELEQVELRGDAADYELLRRRMGMVQRSATYDAAVQGHYGLNLPAYAHSTSPLRRYVDLVNQRLVLAEIRGERRPYDPQQLARLGEEINAGIQAERERKARRHRELAKKATRDRLNGADFSGLSTAEFSKVLRLGLAQTEPVTELLAEVDQRLKSENLPLRDACEILFGTDDEAWAPLRERINERLAAEPTKAVTLVSMYAQAQLGGPLNDSHLSWNVESVGTSRQPCFATVLRLNLPDGPKESPQRLQQSKKDSKAQAALALVAKMSGVEDNSESIDPPDPSEDDPSPIGRVPQDRNPVMAVNEYAQLGAISNPTWDYDRSGPPHAPEFTCRASTEDSQGRSITVSGTGAAKQAAKTAAAAALRAEIESHLPETSAAS